MSFVAISKDSCDLLVLAVSKYAAEDLDTFNKREEAANSLVGSNHSEQDAPFKDDMMDSLVCSLSIMIHVMELNEKLAEPLYSPHTLSSSARKSLRDEVQQVTGKYEKCLLDMWRFWNLSVEHALVCVVALAMMTSACIYAYTI